MIDIIIADDHPVVRHGIKQILVAESDISVVAEASNAQELLEKIDALDCDVVLLDISMPGRGGLDVLSELRRISPKLPVLILSVHSEDQFGMRVLKAGAAGYMNKETAPDELVKAIKMVASGHKYISPSLAEKLAANLAPAHERAAHQVLSDREYQVMCLLASGKTVGEIGRELHLSTKTISTYRARILQKMNLKTNAQLTFYAVQNALVSAAN
jgi:DNA-binding NarL/FixJ family response regulator